MDVEIELLFDEKDEQIVELQERIETLEAENKLLNNRLNTLADNQAVILQVLAATRDNISVAGNVIRIKLRGK